MITKNFKYVIADLLKKWINHFSRSDLIFKWSALKMHDSVFGMLRGINRKHIDEIWEKAQNGELQ